MTYISLVNRITVTNPDNTERGVNARVEGSNDQYIVTCSSQHAQLIRGAKSIAWKPRTLAKQAEKIVLHVLSHLDCSAAYVKFVCTRIANEVALFPPLTLITENDPSVSIELVDYSLKFASKISHEQFLSGDVDVGNQQEQIVLSGSGNAVDKLQDHQRKIFILRIGLTVSHRCILTHLETVVTSAKNTWSVTLEKIGTEE